MVHVITQKDVDMFEKVSQDFISKLNAMPDDEAKEFATRWLINLGALDENGKAKEQIVTGDFFGW